MINQFRTIDDLREEIKELENILMRPTPRLSHPTLYRKRDVSEGEVIIKGVRVKDWCLSEDLKWALPHDQMGLSFSATFSNLKSVYKFKQKHNPGNAIHIHWVLETADIPAGLKFVQDKRPGKKAHWFLTVTDRILLSQLVQKLKMVANRMSIIRDGGKIL
ncbi:MAG: hypothetical protein V4732_17005 [Pseudomonadota bacterium]